MQVVGGAGRLLQRQVQGGLRLLLAPVPGLILGRGLGGGCPRVEAIRRDVEVVRVVTSAEAEAGLRLDVAVVRMRLALEQPRLELEIHPLVLEHLGPVVQQRLLPSCSLVLRSTVDIVDMSCRYVVDNCRYVVDIA